MKSRLIQSTFLGILIVNIISMVSGIMCVMIDAIITGQFLGTEAVTATGYLNPVILLCQLFGAIFGPGVGIVCTRFMGMAKRDRVNQVFSIVMIVMLVTGAIISVALFFTAPLIASALGGRADESQIHGMMVDYLRGYSLGLIPMSLSISLTGLMMLDNDRKRGIVAMAVTLAADIVFDLSNVLVFHGGMWGMAIATSLSSLAGLLVVLTHFLKKDRVLRFTRDGLRGEDVKEVVLCGIPNLITFGSQALRGICFNTLLRLIAGGWAIAALSVCNSAFSIIIAVAQGMFTTTSTICSLLYGEEDRKGLSQALGLSLRIVCVVFALIAAVLLVFAHPIAGLFLSSSAGEELGQATRFIRVMALQYLLGAVSYPLSGAYQGTRRLHLNYLIDALREGVFPILAVMALGMVFGLSGFETGFVVAGLLVLLSCLLIPWRGSGKLTLSPERLLLLPAQYGPKPEELFEASMHSMDEVMDVSQRVMGFCSERGASKRMSFMTSLFVEEVAGNTMQHGFPTGRAGSIDLRLIYRDGAQIIRFRDNGVPFDPADWLRRNHPEDLASGAGLRIIVGLAKDVRYIPAMGLNNLMLSI